MPTSRTLVRRSRIGVVELARHAPAATTARPRARSRRCSIGCRACGAFTVIVAVRARAVDARRRRARSDSPRSSMRPLERRQRDALARPPGDRSAPRARARAPSPCSGMRAAGRSSSTSPHALRVRPRTPSAVVQNTSARSRRTLRLSTRRVRPPVPGSTPSSGTSGRLTVRRAVVDQHDLVAGERQLVAAARAVPLTRGEELEPGVAARVLDAVARLVGELAEVHFPRVRRRAEHVDVRAGAEHALLAAGR